MIFTSRLRQANTKYRHLSSAEVKTLENGLSSLVRRRNLHRPAATEEDNVIILYR